MSAAALNPHGPTTEFAWPRLIELSPWVAEFVGALAADIHLDAAPEPVRQIRDVYRFGIIESMPTRLAISYG